MNSAVGFALIYQGLDQVRSDANDAIGRILSRLEHLKKYSVEIGNTQLILWGREPLQDCIHKMPDGSLLALVGSPIGEVGWLNVQETITGLSRPESYDLPWEGRVILLRISPDGEEWHLWNDWLGSIPIFHTVRGNFRIASTLEPVVVNAGRFTSEDFFLPGLLYMLMHGDFIADWTLYRDMHFAPPDAYMTWDSQGFSYISRQTVLPGETNWENSWDALLEEMHDLSRRAILQVLKTQPSWIVPLSSGLDSRLIAAVGAEANVNIQTYTWGPPSTRDVVYSGRIANVLDLPWRRMDLGADYLEQYVPLWADLFGSSMHFHGMYQLPFLQALNPAQSGRLISGFIGDCLGGYDTRFMVEYHSSAKPIYYSHPDCYIFWDVASLKSLLKLPIQHALDEIEAKIEECKHLAPGRFYQRLRYFVLWGRQRHFTYFQSMLSDYWRGVATPYLNRDYVRFCLSIPRPLLDNRFFQIEMMKRYYPKIMSIGGTYANKPAILSGSYILKKRLARYLPGGVTNKLFPEFSAAKNIKTDILSLRVGGRKSIWPIDQSLKQLGEWFHLDQLEIAYQTGLDGDIRGVRKMQSVQTIAYRLLDRQER